MPLTDRDCAILNLEGVFFAHSSSKDDRIQVEIGMRPTNYYQRLNVLIDEPAALRYAPTTVNRLLRLRDTRRKARTMATRGTVWRA